jgi:uncharacterized membrane protein YdbT with pleckstrin-like domain
MSQPACSHAEVFMSYVNSVLQPGERIVVRGRLHWIVYWYAILFFVLGVVLVLWESAGGMGDGMISFTSITFGVLFAVAFLYAWFIRWTTEIAVTDRRVIYKEGFITRHTVEIHMDKVASVDVDQSILGRLLGYGMVHVVGTGGAPHAADPNAARGIERHRVASPLALRSAITAK